MFSKTVVFLSRLGVFAFITMLVFSGCENLFGEEDDEKDGTQAFTLSGNNFVSY
ncbi:MAG: hypothetical protein PF508_06745 [Spirochaeta sp.]|jgi:hypothetical protein|nr:hypothetical protein [Spirochaeta sp.]